MLPTVKKILKNAISPAELGYKLIRGNDYRALIQYIIRINSQKGIDDILREVSRCLKELLGYELFGFVLKSEGDIDVWIDPARYTSALTNRIAEELGGQNIDCAVHYFENNTPKDSRNPDTIDLRELLAYNVIDDDFLARMYILPKRKMLSRHDTIVDTIVSSVKAALEKILCIRQLENAAAVDPLTNCYNRRALNAHIERDIAYAQRYGNDLAVIMFDMDNFKGINDRHGHLAGDAVLKGVSALITSLVRKSDYLARYGGEEFVLVLPDTTLSSAVQLAEKFRKQIAAQPVVVGGENIPVTASFGVASLHHQADGSGLVHEADQRMYQAKAAGKNRVVPDFDSSLNLLDYSVGRLLRKYAGDMNRENISPKVKFSV
jgi:diguanylate cyclase (GGDEF)-like protein